MRRTRKYLLVILPLFFSLPVLAQNTPSTPPCIVGRIIVKGNKKTKNYIVLRELSFKPGDTLTIGDLVKGFRSAHDRLINTHLFNEVIIFLKEFQGYVADVEIDVKERWYIF